MNRDVVITGLGLVTSMGTSPEDILAALASTIPEARPPAAFKASAFLCRVAREITGFDPGAYGFDVKTLRLMSRDAIFAAGAARLAVRDAGVNIGRDYLADRVALFGTTGLSGIAFEEVSSLIRNSATPDGRFDSRLFGEVALKKILPTLSFKILTNMPICFISIFEGIQGMNAVYNPWEGQGARAIAAGIDAITFGDADCALVGGCDVKTSILGFLGLQQEGVWNPDQTCIAPTEGAAFLVLEEESAARRRNARIHARLGPYQVSTYEEKGSSQEKADQSKVFLDRFRKKKPADLVSETFELLSSQIPQGLEKSLEQEFLTLMGWKPDRVIFPKMATGDCFAGAAAIQMVLAASRARVTKPGGWVVSTSFGHGSEKAVFTLQNPTPTMGCMPPKSHGWRMCSGEDPHDGGSGPLAPGWRTSGGPIELCGYRPSVAGTPVSQSRPETKKRVVVTGIGMVSPVGNSREESWKNLVAGISGLGPVTLFDASALMVRIGGEVKNLDTASLTAFFPGLARERDRKIWLGLAAAREALDDAGIQASQNGTSVLREATLHVGVSLEVFFLEDVTPVMSAADLGQAMSDLILCAPDRAEKPPLQTPLDRIATLIGDHYGMFGGRSTICSACAAGAQVVGEALRFLQNGKAEIALAGAADSMLNPLGLGGFSLLRALSTENDRPLTACRPFDATRLGTVLGEGASFLVLETLEHARQRGARIYAEVLGYGSSLDAYRVSDPEPGGRGAILSMRKALDDAGLKPEAIDCVNAHGTGTPKNDAVETMAIKQVLGARSMQIPVHAIKSMTGHLIGASGAVEAATSVLSLSRGVIPPTINLKEPDPDCDLDYVTEGSRPFAGRTVLSNSFGFGGQNATLIFGRFPG